MQETVCLTIRLPMIHPPHGYGSPQSMDVSVNYGRVCDRGEDLLLVMSQILLQRPSPCASNGRAPVHENDLIRQGDVLYANTVFVGRGRVVESGTSWKENACCEWKVLIQFWGDLWENRTLFNHTTNKGYCLKDDNFFSLIFFLHLLLNEETTSALDTGGTGSGRERPTEIEP